MMLTDSVYRSRQQASQSARKSLMSGFDGHFKLQGAKKDLEYLRENEERYTSFLKDNGLKNDEEALLYLLENVEEINKIKERLREEQRQMNAGLSDLVDIHNLDEEQRAIVQKRLSREKPLRKISSGYMSLADKI